jgi:hypothetical protein
MFQGFDQPPIIAATMQRDRIGTCRFQALQHVPAL